MNLGQSKLLAIVLCSSSLLLAGCGNNSDTSTTDSNESNSSAFSGIFDSANVNLVKNGYVSACPSASLGEMADAFMSGPNWNDFTAIDGTTIVELTGEISYEGLPTEAKLQFTVSGSTFNTSYLGIGGQDQSQLMIVALLNKMCEAAL